MLDAAPASCDPTRCSLEEPVAELAIAILEEGQRRLSDAAASLDEADELDAAGATEAAAERARDDARSRRR